MQIGLVGVGLETNVLRDIEEARFHRYLGTRWQKENVTVNLMMGIGGQCTWANWVTEWLVLSMTDTGRWDSESGFEPGVFQPLMTRL